MAQREQHGTHTTARQAADADGPVIPPPPEGHGHSVAAWTSVAIILVGSLLAAFGVVFLWYWLIILGMALAVVVGPAAAIVLSKMGYGAETHKNGRDGASDASYNGPR